MNQMQYRQGCVSDVEELTRLRVQMLCEEANYPEHFRETLHANTAHYLREGFADNSCVVWVAEWGGSIAAMCTLTLFTLPPNDWCPNGNSAYLSGMYTVPEHRRQGIAKELLALAVEEAGKLGCERVLLHTSDMGKQLYGQFGFVNSAHAMAYYPK